MTMPRRVLVVDDDPVVRRIVGSTLERAGFLVEYATDGDAGWLALQQQSFTLVITDRSMPNVDGLELMRRIRTSTEYASLPVILLSSSAEEALGPEAKTEGANAFISKVLSSAELLTTVERVLSTAPRTA